MIIVDSHCHLNFPQFEGKLQDIISAAKDNNVQYMQTICTKISEYEAVYKIANDNANIFSSCGIHPHEADNEEISLEELIKLASRPKNIAIGETGLDYYYEHSDRERQKSSFITHLEAALELDIPVIIHTRDAEEDTYDILHDFVKKAENEGKINKHKKLRALIHCFTSSADFAKKMLDMGLYISISGIITFKSAKDLQDTVRNLVPLDKMLVETDSPYLAPIPFRGKTNQPAYTRNTLEFIATMKGVTTEELAEITTNNFFDLFSKAQR